MISGSSPENPIDIAWEFDPFKGHFVDREIFRGAFMP
jgi:hypothetical protein